MAAARIVLCLALVGSPAPAFGSKISEDARPDETYSVASRCLLEVDRTIFIDGPCQLWISDSDGSFQMFAMGDEPIYFAQVDITGKNLAAGWWNLEPYANHAHVHLGELERNGACWSNRHARICAWK